MQDSMKQMSDSFRKNKQNNDKRINDKIDYIKNNKRNVINSIKKDQKYCKNYQNNPNSKTNDHSLKSTLKNNIA